MRIRKTAEQKNFRVDEQFYTSRELKRLSESGDIYSMYMGQYYVVFADNASEIKVVYDESCGMYTTVVVLKTGKQIYVAI